MTNIYFSLPINFYIFGLLHAAPSAQPIESTNGATSSICGNCYKCRKVVSSHCAECSLILCSECFANTHAASFTAHRLVSISTKPNHQNQFNELVQKVFCQQHHQSSFFCVDCNTLICIGCNKKHRAHKIESVEEAVSAADPFVLMLSFIFIRLQNAGKGPLITKSLNRFKDQLAGYQRTSVDLETFTDKMRDFAREASEDIDIKFARVIAFTQMLQIEKKKELQNETSSIFKRLEVGKQMCGENCSMLKDAIDVLENIFTKTLKHCLTDDLLAELDQVLPEGDLTPIGLKKTTLDNPFRFEFVGEITHVIRERAKVTVSKNVIPEINVSREKLEQAKVNPPSVSRQMSRSSRFSSELSNESLELMYERSDGSVDEVDGGADNEKLAPKAPTMSDSALPEIASRSSRSLRSHRGGLAKTLQLMIPTNTEIKRTETEPKFRHIYSIDKIKMTKNERLDVKITKIKDFDDFYACVINFEDEAERRETFASMQESYNKHRSNEPIKRLHDGFYGVVKIDGIWLRCIVTKVLGTNCEVFTVDTAQTLRICNQDLHCIGKRFMMPKQAAIHCCLEAIIAKVGFVEHMNKLLNFKKTVIDSGFPIKIEVMSDSNHIRPVPVTVIAYPPNSEPINVNKKFAFKPKPM